MTVKKRKRVPSVLVDCTDCAATFEVEARTFDLAVEVADTTPAPFRCDDCREGDVPRSSGGGES